MSSLSINDNDHNNILRISPNPTYDFITINGLKSTENYRIYNVLGTEVTRGTITDNTRINIKNYSKGLYFLKLDNGNTLKFIKK